MSKVLLGILAGLIVAGSVYFCLDTDPEKIIVQSADGAVTLSGKRTIDSLIGISFFSDRVSPFTSSIYEIFPESNLPSPFTISWIYQGNRTGMGIYRQSAGSDSWELIPESVNRLSAQSLAGGLFAVAPVSEVEVPVFYDALDQLLSRAPAKTVGLTVFSDYRLAGDKEWIRLDSGVATAGCSGEFALGDREEKGEEIRLVEAAINGLEEKFELRYGAIYQTIDGANGCLPGEELKYR